MRYIGIYAPKDSTDVVLIPGDDVREVARGLRHYINSYPFNLDDLGLLCIVEARLPTSTIHNLVVGWKGVLTGEIAEVDHA